MVQYQQYVEIFGAKENNLKNVTIKIPKNKFVVITGPSGSGKSSLAFDVLYAEGQRRYLNNISGARYFSNIPKPNVEKINGLIPTIAIDQKTTARNPRSTVGTMTDIYDYLRLLYAKIGKVYSPLTGLILYKKTFEDIISSILDLPQNTKIRLCSPILIKQHSHVCEQKIIALKQAGEEKVKINGKLRNIDELIPLDIEKEYTLSTIIDRIIISQDIDHIRLEHSIKKCLDLSDGSVSIDIVDMPVEKCQVHGIEFQNKNCVTLSTKYLCTESGFKLDLLEPKIFSFNSPYGACKNCCGLGLEYSFKKELIVPYPEESLIDGAIKPWSTSNTKYINQIIIALSKHYGFNLETPFEKLPENIQNIILYGSGEEKIEFILDDGEFQQTKIKKIFEGAIPELEKKYADIGDDPLLLEECERFRDFTECHVCSGYRLLIENLQVKIDNYNISQVAQFSIENFLNWIENLHKILNTEEIYIAESILNEISTRLKLLINIGLKYLTLDRSANTLSGGEAQRIRLSNQMGSGLSGVLYVLDEPSIGLHQSDNARLIESIKALRDIGNSVVVIEHDEETMQAADYIIDVGPGAGTYGGEIIASGTLDEICIDENSLTGFFLSGKEKIETPKAFRKYGRNNTLSLKGAKGHNLKNVNLNIPLGKFVAICGVSGGGKSSLIIDTLYPAVSSQINRIKKRALQFDSIEGLENIDKIIKIDQSAIGRTPRSNPATYIGVFSIIRDFFTSLPEARYRGYTSSRFSFNVKGGRCENCHGDGVTKIEMQFLPDIYVSCPVCKGHRYNKSTLEIMYNGKNISNVLNMTVYEALEFFKDNFAISEKLQCLYNVGLDYIKLGQSSTTLSGGEAQRIKLSKELSKRATGDTIYILDEPTTGLHSHDIKRLLNVLHLLVDQGNTVLVIEHNLDVIKTADYVIDIGPEGGDKGGYIIAEGTPIEIANTIDSITGKFLKKYYK